MARGFVSPALAELAARAGLWHDLGKYRPGFQAYVREDMDAHVEGRPVVTSSKTHSAAGALHAIECMTDHHGGAGRLWSSLVAQLIASHHHGLYDHADLQERLFGGRASDSRREYEEAIAECRRHAPELLNVPDAIDPVSAIRSLPGLSGKSDSYPEPLAVSLAVRMSFSALVDADFLDTEAYLNGQRAARRAGFASIATYRARLDDHLSEMAAKIAEAGRAGEAVMRARAQVLDDCRAAAASAPGVFSLQVPTGGGKTLASLAFALSHAERHGLGRVIIAIPYTSIVEQTADVLAGIFGRDAVVEHHSQADAGDGDGDNRSTARSRLSCENWDAPLIVTTNVQLLESLFAARTSRCRKLHRLRNSVIVLDEAQVLPPSFLQPTLDALRLLSLHYGVSIVSCTATQPVLSDIERFDCRRSLRGLTRGAVRPKEIVVEVEPLYAHLQRVRFRWPDDLIAPEPIADVARRVAQHPAALAIVNTRADASDLLSAVNAASADAEPSLHLSAAMCGQHRADVIASIRDRLAARLRGDLRPLRVVSTQLVEAGVDVDFPVVFRALAGLDSIAQAAGRCNREGRLGPSGGHVEVFVRPIPGVLASLARAADSTRAVLAGDRPEVLPLAVFQRYFEHWYGSFDLDERRIVDMLRNNPQMAFQFESAARAYRLVDDENQCSVVVPYAPVGGDTSARDGALAALERGNAERWHLRALQRYVVQAPVRDATRWLARGDVAEPMPGWFVLKDQSRYHPHLGLLREGAALDASSLFQ
jgi:CRISPR-associated endonuclease/helicase Cas3